VKKVVRVEQYSELNLVTNRRKKKKNGALCCNVIVNSNRSGC